MAIVGFNRIPDYYNTGVQDPQSLEVLDFNLTDGVAYDTMGWMYLITPFTDKSGDNNYISFPFTTSKNKPLVGEDGIILIQNIDFIRSSLSIWEYVKNNRDGIDSFKVDFSSIKKDDVTIKFVNCRFAKIIGAYIINEESGNFHYIFENCDIEYSSRFANATYKRCRFGCEANEYYSIDGVYADSNNVIEDCYFYYKFAPITTIRNVFHLDGVQLNGADGANGYITRNIRVNNCRIELPFTQFMDNDNVQTNSCLFIDPQGGNVDDIHVSDCIINGGGYVIRFHDRKNYAITNSFLKNIKYGVCHKYGLYYPVTIDGVQYTRPKDENTIIENVIPQDGLYITDIFEKNGEIGFRVSNDTDEERTLTVVTDVERVEYVISACPNYSELSSDKTWDETMTMIDQTFYLPKGKTISFYEGEKMIAQANVIEDDVKYSINKNTLVEIADAIRTQYGESDKVAVTDFAEAIAGIEGGGGGGFPYEVIEFSVAEDTADAQEFDFTLIDGITDYSVLVIPKGCYPTKAQNYTVLGYTPFGGNPVLATSYNGTAGMVQFSNCPMSIDATIGHVVWGECGGNYRFRDWVEYIAIIIPRKDLTA